MAERWHAPGDLVGLPDMPRKGTRSITLRAQKGKLVSRREGKRILIAESSLSEETQAALRAKRDEAPSEAAEEPRRDAPPAPNADQVADARLEILTALEKWLGRGNRLRLDEALAEFSRLYAAGDVDASEETRDAVRRISRRSLIRWRRDHRKGGWAALKPRSRTKRTKAAIEADETLANHIAAHIIDRYPHQQSPHLLDDIEAEFGIERTPGLRTLQRFMARWIADHPDILSQLSNPDRHRSTRTPAFGSAIEAIERFLERVEFDGSPADILCTDGIFVLMSGIDCWSRLPVTLVTPTESSAAFGALLRRWLLERGVMEAAVTDGGKGFVSHHSVRVFDQLGVEHVRLPPYHPEMKPFIERWFGTLQRGLIRELPGFKGHSVAERQQLRSKYSLQARRGATDRELFSVSLSSEEIQARIDDWTRDVYERRSHSGKGMDDMSPFEKAASWTGAVRKPPSERALDVLLLPGGHERTVAKDGIATAKGEYIAAELGPFVGHKVHVRPDPADWGVILVFEEDKATFICRAFDPERTGINRAEIAARAKAAAKVADREGREYARRLKREHRPEHSMSRVLAHKKAQAEKVATFPRRTEEHETPALDEAERAADDAGERPAAREKRAPERRELSPYLTALRGVLSTST